MRAVRHHRRTRTGAGGSCSQPLPHAIVAAKGGAALIIDYGHEQPGFGDTLQAVKRHRRHDALDEPGNADLTAHVDFFAH